MLSAPSKNRTKKCKSKVNKSKLWDAFDVEFNTRERANSLELLYSKQDIHKREFCELCKSTLSSKLEAGESHYMFRLCVCSMCIYVCVCVCHAGVLGRWVSGSVPNDCEPGAPSGIIGCCSQIHESISIRHRVLFVSMLVDLCGVFE